MFRRHWPYAFVIAAPIILFAPFLLGVQMVYWGTPLLQFYPWRLAALESVRAGFLPLWNPWLGNGAPLAANYQSALFYPPNWLSLIIPLDLSLNWLMVLHIIWAGVGMVKLARSLNYSLLGQVVTGLAFGMGQYVVARASFYSINAAVAWLPWVIWATDKLLNAQFSVHNTQWRQVALSRFAFHGLRLSSILALQLLTGHAQTTWYTYLLLAAWVLWRAFSQPITQSSITKLITNSLILLLSFLLAILLASIQLLPAFELLQQSPRAEAAEYEFVMTYSFSPWRLLTFLAPDFLGNPARGQFYGYGNYIEDAVYVGIIPLLFALVAGSKIFRRQLPNHSITQSSISPILLFLILPITLILALGRNTPIFPWLYANVPTFDMFQAPTRMMVWFVFALALLAGQGVEQWATPQGRALYWTRLGTAGAVALMGTAGATLLGVDTGTRVGQLLSTAAWAALTLGVNLLAVGLLSLFKPKSQSMKWELAVAVCLAADLLYANYGIHPPAPADLYRAPTESGRALAAELGDQRLYQFPADRERVMFEPYFSFLTYGEARDLSVGARAVQLPNVGVLEGVASANNFDPLVSKYYKGFTDVVSETQSVTLLNLMNVGAVTSSEELPWEVITSAREVVFYRVPGEAKRLWLLPESEAQVLEVADEAASRTAIASPAFNPAQQIVLEASDAGWLAPAPLSEPITPHNPNGFSISLNLHQANWVVLADTWYPGWYAYVDGQPTPLRRANYAFRAVWVPAGAHRVEFLYAPPTFQLAVTLTGVGLLIWLALAVAVWRMRGIHQIG